MSPKKYILYFLFSAIDNLIDVKTCVNDLDIDQSVCATIKADIQELLKQAERLKGKIKEFAKD